MTDMHQIPDDPCDDIMGPGGRPPDDVTGDPLVPVFAAAIIGAAVVIGVAIIIIF